MTLSNWYLEDIDYGIGAVIGPGQNPSSIPFDMIEHSDQDIRINTFEGNIDEEQSDLEDDTDPMLSSETNLSYLSDISANGVFGLDNPKSAFSICFASKSILNDIRDDNIQADCNLETSLDHWVRLFLLEYKTCSKYWTKDEVCTLSMNIFSTLINIQAKISSDFSEDDISCLEAIRQFANSSLSATNYEGGELIVEEWREVTFSQIVVLCEAIIPTGRVFVDYLSNWLSVEEVMSDPTILARRLFLGLIQLVLMEPRRGAGQDDSDPINALYTLSFYYYLIEKYVLCSDLGHWMSMINHAPVWTMSEVPDDFVDTVKEDIIRHCSDHSKTRTTIDIMYRCLESRLLSRCCIKDYAGQGVTHRNIDMSDYFDSRTTANNTYITLMLEYQSPSLVLPSRLFSKLRVIHSRLNVIGKKDTVQIEQEARDFIEQIAIPIISECTSFENESIFGIVEKIFNHDESRITLHDLHCLFCVRQCMIEGFVEIMVSGENAFSVGKDQILAESYDNFNTRKIPIIRAFKRHDTLIHYSNNRYAVVRGASIIDCEHDYCKAMSLLRHYIDSNKKKRKSDAPQFGKIKGLHTVVGRTVSIVRKKNRESAIVSYVPSDSTKVRSDHYENVLKRIQDNNKDRNLVNRHDSDGLNYFVFGTGAEKLLNESRELGSSLFNTPDYLSTNHIAHHSVSGSIQAFKDKIRSNKQKK